MNYRAIIFDMDGTIVDTENLWRQASKTLIANRGYTLSKEEECILYEQLPGIGLPNACRLIKDLIKTDDSIEILMKEKSAIACQLYESGICFINGFPEFYRKATEIPLKMAVATNATIQTMEITDKSLNLCQYFGKHLYTINHVNNIGKPNPAIYLYAAKQLGIDPKECIAIEDSGHGILAAKTAGMFCIGINTGKDLEKIKHADLTVECYADINLAALLQ